MAVVKFRPVLVSRVSSYIIDSMPVPAIIASVINSVVSEAVNAAMENAVYPDQPPAELR